MRLYTSQLVKKYKARTVVNHVSIDVSQGEIVGLLGPNGAGKTTTFYMIVGLIKPNEGQIFLENDQGGVAELTDLPVYRRAQLGVGYLAQEASVFRRLSVEDNIRSVLEMTDFSKEYQRERLESLIEEFRLQKVRRAWASSSRAASAAAPRSPARWPSTRPSSFWTSLSRASTRSPWRTSSRSSPRSSTRTSA